MGRPKRVNEGRLVYHVLNRGNGRMRVFYKGLGDQKGVRNLLLALVVVQCSFAGMGRPKRVDEGGLVYHVLDRGNGRMHDFYKDADYEAFETILADACKCYDMRLLAYCLMPNHWHLVLWPRQNGDLSAFVRWLTLMHTQRWHAHRGDIGTGHVYQGRFKSFVVQTDAHLARLCRYVERNALRAGLVDRAEDWPWGSLWL